MSSGKVEDVEHTVRKYELSYMCLMESRIAEKPRSACNDVSLANMYKEKPTYSLSVVVDDKNIGFVPSNPTSSRVFKQF
jgi:hypothetical protein